MNQRAAKWMWNQACCESLSEDAEKPTALGCMLIPLDVPALLQMSSPQWHDVSKFLREWADAIDGDTK